MKTLIIVYICNVFIVMDAKLALIQGLIGKVDAYFHAGNNNADPSLFAQWLVMQGAENQSGVDEKDAGTTMRRVGNRRSNLSFFLVRLRKFAGHYLKYVFDETPFSGVDDFSFLGTLMYEGPMRKIDVIKANATDGPTGMDILKRLIRNELIETERHLEDKRAVLVKATVKGRMAFLGVLPALEKAGTVIEAELPDAELDILLGILDRMDRYHSKIFKESSSLDPQTLLYERQKK